MMNKENQKWDIIITPNNSNLLVSINGLWKYKDLIMLFVKRDIVSFYKQTILGPIWYFIQPVFTTIIFTFVFGKLASISTDGLPHPLFYLTGITAWNYFADCLTKTSTVFKDNAAIFGKVYFPRMASPLSIVISSLFKFSIQLFLLLIMILFYLIKGYSFAVSWHILLFPLFVLLMAMQGLGLGMIITAMTIKYRDLSFLVTFGVQLMMYGTSVIYPLSSLSGKMYWLVALNPVTYLIEGFKASLLGVGALNFFSICYSILITLIITFFGIFIFNKVEKKFIDTI